MSEYNNPGKTTLTSEVLLTIARMAVLEVEGVCRMSPIKGGVNSLLGRGNDGVRIAVEDNTAFIDLYLVLDNDVNIRETSRTIQAAVARAIADITGLEVGHVNVHIEDIDYNSEA